MKILHLSTSDSYGGAAQAAYRLHCLLREAGHESVMAVRQRLLRDESVIAIGASSVVQAPREALYERVRHRVAGAQRVEVKQGCFWNTNTAPIPDFSQLDQCFDGPPDILFLHWVTGFLTASDIQRLAKKWKCPVVWLVMDMEPFTGGCHYAGDCVQYKEACTFCPQLTKNQSFVQRTWHAKHDGLKDLPISWVAPTRWLLSQLRESALFCRHEAVLVPLAMSSVYKPSAEGRARARAIMGLPDYPYMIFTGVHNLKDTRKGMSILLEALNRLKDQLSRNQGEGAIEPERVCVLLAGHLTKSWKHDIPFPVHTFGYMNSEIELSLAYQSADLYVSPSLEDGGPMMVSQSMLCGTPVVAFNTGIAEELLGDGTCGYMAALGDSVDLAHGMVTVLQHSKSMSPKAAERASEHHSHERIARQLEQVFESTIIRYNKH